MGDKTAISWTDATWNPVVGCSHASPGCDHCYAERFAGRLRGMGRPEYQEAHDGQRWTGRTAFLPERLSQPLSWRKPRRIFPCSMGDLFHESVSNEQIAAVFGIMAGCPQHTFQVLTKRADRMREWFRWIAREPVSLPAATTGPARGALWHAWNIGVEACVPSHHRPWGWPLPNVWLGVTAEDQRRADERIPHLLQCPAALRFVSVEPMVGAVDLLRTSRLTMRNEAPQPRWLHQLSWVICGGESGPGARPMHPEWARSLRDQCKAAGVAFHFKQWGEWATGAQMSEAAWVDLDRSDHGAPDDDRPYRVGKAAAGHLLDGVEHREWPEVRDGR